MIRRWQRQRYERRRRRRALGELVEQRRAIYARGDHPPAALHHRISRLRGELDQL